LAKFTAKVRIIAESSYEVEIDTDTEANAESEARGMWREKLPGDFQVARGYISNVEVETEQLTADCPRCNKEHTIPTADRSEADSDSWHEDSEYCRACGVIIEQEDKDIAAT
jgi:hypothetical protein